MKFMSTQIAIGFSQTPLISEAITQACISAKNQLVNKNADLVLVLACPSHREPLGRVVFEAWDAGAVPVVFAGAGEVCERLSLVTSAQLLLRDKEVRTRGFDEERAASFALLGGLPTLPPRDSREGEDDGHD